MQIDRATLIPESNLLDGMTRSPHLLDEIKKQRCNQILIAATFIDSTTCFKDICKVSDEINMMCHGGEAAGTILMEHLTFLQNMVTKMREGLMSCSERRYKICFLYTYYSTLECAPL